MLTQSLPVQSAMGFDLVMRGATVATPGHREVTDIGSAHAEV